ncbi:MAG: hypothetical protein KAU48_00180 [Candidatus Thorarchaeota archaeon]|nr:hypothetical protein [Candidatus Thorarchaeota archaeon]
MKIRLRPEHPRIVANNVTKATSREFADLIRVLETADKPEKAEGHFKLYRKNKGSVYLELEFEGK